jgi:hypothetical protein
MDKPKITPKDFFLWLGAMAFLYVSVFSFVSLIFRYLDYTFPDPLQYYATDPYSGGISYLMASLIVLLPLFLLLMRLIRKSIAADPTRGDLWVRRWALYLTLFLAGITVAADLITLIMYFFNGDVTIRFLLKVVTILLVAGAGFLHFLADLNGFWTRNPGQARMVGWGVGVLVLLTIVAGFFIIGTPWEARLYRYDEQKVQDLANIQSQIVEHWRSKQSLPASLEGLNDSLGYYVVPRDAQTGAAYEYRTTGALSFELCASFNAVSQPGAGREVMPMYYPGQSEIDSWHHGEGRTCFSRTIDPDLYPPFTKPTF